MNYLLDHPRENLNLGSMLDDDSPSCNLDKVKHLSSDRILSCNASRLKKIFEGCWEDKINR